jgi:hypothetical protein
MVLLKAVLMVEVRVGVKVLRSAVEKVAKWAGSKAVIWAAQLAEC